MGKKKITIKEEDLLQGQDLDGNKDEISIPAETPKNFTIKEEDLVSPLIKRPALDVDHKGRRISDTQIVPIQGTKKIPFKRVSKDLGLLPGLDVNQYRAATQSNWDKFGNFAARSLFEGVVGETVGAVGSIIGLPEAVYNKVVTQKSSDFNNIITDFAEKIKEGSREQFPIYRQDPEATFDIKDFGWWAENGVSVSSTLGLIIPGFSAGKLAGRAFKGIASGLSASQRFTEVGTALSELGTSAFVMRNAEGFMESSALVLQTREDLLNKWRDAKEWEKVKSSQAASELLKNGGELTRTELANYIASKAGWRAYNLNLSNITFDILQIAPVFKSVRRLSRGRVKPTTSAGDRTGVSQLFNRFGGMFLRQSTEGIEEGVNFISSEEGKAYGKSLLGENIGPGFARTAEYFTDGNFWESAFWGVIGGVAFEGAGRGLSRLAEGVARERETQQNIQKNAGNIREQEVRKNLINEASKTLNALNNKSTYISPEGQEIDLSNIPESRRLEYVDDIKYNLGVNLGINAANSGNIDVLLEQLDNSELQQELINQGLISNEEATEQTQFIKQAIEKGEAIYNKNVDNFITLDESDETKNLAFKKASNIDIVRAFNQRKKVLSLNRETELKANSITYNNLITSNPAYENLLNLKSLKQVRDTIESRVDDLDTTLDKERIKSRVNKTLDQLEKAERDILEGIKLNEQRLDSETEEIIQEKALQTSVDLLEPELAASLKELTKKQGINVIKKNIKEDKAKDRTARLSDIEQQISILEPLPEDNLNTLISKKAKLTELKGQVSKDLEVIAGSKIDRALRNIDRAERIIQNTGKVEEAKKDIKESPRTITTIDDLQGDTSDITIDEDGPVLEGISASSLFESEVEIDDSIPSVDNIPATDINQQISDINPENIETSEPNPVQDNVEPKIDNSYTLLVKNNIIKDAHTAIALAEDEGIIISADKFNDTSNITVIEGTPIHKLLSGQIRENQTVFLTPNMEATIPGANPNRSSTLVIEIRDKENVLLGYLNTVSGKQQLLNKELLRLQKEGLIKEDGKYLKSQDQAIRNKADLYIDSIRKEIENLKDIRQRVFDDRASLSLAPLRTRIGRMTSGSIINTKDRSKIRDIFGDNLVLYTAFPTDSTILEAPNLEESEDFFRLADIDSILNNADSLYTRGAYYTLVEAPNGTNFPIRLFNGNITQPFASRIFDAFERIIDLNATGNVIPEDIKALKDFINEIVYVGKGGVEIFNNEITFTYPKDDQTKRVRIFFNRFDRISGRPQINLQSGFVEDGRFIKESDIFNNPNSIRDFSITELQNLLFNTNKKLVNKVGEYFSPLNKDFDGTPFNNAVPFNNYLDFINATEYLQTDVGLVLNEKGDKLGHFSVKGKSNLVIEIELPKMTTTVPDKTNIQLNIDSNVTSKVLDTKFTTFSKYVSSIGIKKSIFDKLYEYADTSGIKIDNSRIPENGLLAQYDRDSNTITLNKTLLATKEQEGADISQLLEEILAHEVIHGYIINNVVKEKALNEELVEFIKGIKEERENAPNNIKTIIDYILENNPQEVVAFAFTNIDFASWLSGIKVDTGIESTTLLGKLKQLLFNIIRIDTGFNKLDELNTLIDKNLSHDINPNRIEDSGDFSDILSDVLGFPNLQSTPSLSKDMLTRQEINTAVNVLSAYFIRVQDNLPNKTESQYKFGLYNTLINKAKEDDYKASSNLVKVLNNYDLVWENVKRNLSRTQKITFNKEAEEDREFVLQKDFEDSGAYERNVKDNVPTAVKDIIRRTPIVSEITKNGPVLDKNNFLQLPTFLNFDTIYPYLQDKLSDIVNKDDLIDRLEDLSQYEPSLILISERLKENNNLLSAWVSHFDKQKVDYVTDIITSSGPVLNYKSIISNRNNPDFILADSYRDNILNNLELETYDITDLNRKISTIGNLIKNYSKNRDNLISTLSDLLNGIGVDITRDVIEKELVSEENLKRFRSEQNILSSLFLKPSRFILDNISKGKFDNYNDLLKLSSIISKHTIIPLQNTLFNVEGSTMYGITLPSFISRYFKLINLDNQFANNRLNNLISQYNNTPSLTKSNWVQLMTNNDGTINREFFTNFNYYVEDGIKNSLYNTGIRYNNFTDADWDYLNLLKYISKTGKNFVDLPILIPADSSNIHYLTVPRFSVNYTDEGKISTSSPLYKAIRNIALQEIEAMKQAKDLMFNIDSEGNITLNEDLDTKVLQLNYHYKIIGNKRVYIKDGIPVGNVFKFNNIPELNSTSLRVNGLIADGYNGPDQVAELDNAIKSFINSVVLRSRETFEPYRSRIENLATTKGTTWNRLLTDFSLNSFIANVEMSNLLFGHISEFKDITDMGKRLKQVTAPGLAQSNVFGKPTFNIVVLADVVKRSDSIEEVSKVISSNLLDRKSYTKAESDFNIENILSGFTNTKLEKDTLSLVRPYLSINTTDAQGYITLDRYENILANEGRLTDEIKESIRKAREGEAIDIPLEPVKGFFYDRFYDESLNKFISKQIKYSTIPLIPAFTSGTELDEIRRYMENNSVDEVIYESAYKVGTKNINKVHDDNNRLDVSLLKGSTIETLSNSGWQRQLDVPDDIEDSEKLLGVQISRIIFGNGNEDLRKEYSDIISANIAESADNLLNKLGFILNEEGILSLSNPRNLQSMFNREIESRSLPTIYSEGIEFQNGSLKFKLPLSISPLASKYQSIFLAQFTNNVTDQTVPGLSAVQFSDAFTQVVTETDLGIEYVNTKDPSEPLKFLDKDNVAEILLPRYDSRFKDINNIPEDSRTIIGYRIPTDSKHSMITFKVVGFLPRESSSVAVIPKELVTQMGSDFDVDKLFIISYNLDNSLNKIDYDTNKLPLEQSLEARQNRILDIFQSILKKDTSELVTPSEFSIFESIANKSDTLYAIEESEANILTYEGQKDLRNKNLSGKNLTGIAANFNAFSYVAQSTGMVLDTPISVIYSKSNIDVPSLKRKYSTRSETSSTIEVLHNKLGNNNNNDFLNVNNDRITDILAESLASAVDTVKNPLHPRFNSNVFTFPVFATMSLSGIDPMIAGMFINQPIIKRLSEEFFIQRSSIVGDSSSYINNVRRQFEDKLLKLQGKNRKVYNALLLKGGNEAGNYIGYDREESISLSLTELFNNIKDSLNVNINQTPEKIDYYIRQLEVLETFINIRKASNAINNLIQATKVDNLGAGPSISTTLSLLDNIESSNTTVSVEGEIFDTYPIKIDNNNPLKEIYPRFFNLDQESKYSSLESYLDNSNLLSLQASSELFIEATPYFRNYVRNFIETNNMSISKDNINRINRQFISRLISRSPALVETDFNNLIDNIAQQVIDVQSRFPNLSNDSTHILYYLTANIPDKTVNYSSSNDPVHIENMHDSFRELYNSGNEDLEQLAIDLFKYAFIRNGLNFSFNSFANILPVELYQDLGIVETLNDFHERSKVGDISFDEVDDDNIVRNNWRNRDLVPSVRKRQVNKLDNGFISLAINNPFISNKVKSSDYIYYPEYRRATSSELKENPNNRLILERDHIYQKIYATEERYIYMPISKLGERGKIMDFYDSINTEDKEKFNNENFPYNNVEEALDLLSDLFPSGTFINNITNDANQSVIEGTSLEESEVTEGKINRLNEAFRDSGIEIVIESDTELEANAQVVTENDISTITINPSRVFDDTIIHEYGHLYVDMIGYNTPEIQFGINQLRNTQLWKDVRQAYPELSKEKFEKEVLVTAIGREGANIWKDSNKESRFKRWLGRIWQSVARLLGVELNVARKLAKELINAKLQKNLTTNPVGTFQSRKLKVSSVKEFIDKRIIDLKKQIERFSKDEDFVQAAESLVKELDTLDTIESVDSVINYIDKRIKAINKRIDAVSSDFSPSPSNFSKLYNSFVVLNSFNDLVKLDIDNITGKDNEDNILRERLEELKKRVEPLTATEVKLDATSRELFRRKLTTISSNPDIINDTIDIFDAQVDESTVQRWLDALADTNNSFIALAVKDYNIALDKKNSVVRNTIRTFDSWDKKLKNAGISYDEFFEKDEEGNRTGRLITEFNHIAYADSKDDMWAEISKLKVKADALPPGKERSNLYTKRSQIKLKWFNENHEENPDADTIIAKQRKQLSQEDFEDWFRSQTRKIGNAIIFEGELGQPNSAKYASESFKELISGDDERSKLKREFYNYFRDLMNDLVDSSVTTMFEEGYIPAVPIDTRTYLKAIKEDILRMKDSDNVKPDDQKMVYVDENGRVVSILMLPYIRQLGQIEVPDTSKEVMQSLPEEEKLKLIDKKNKIVKKNRKLHAQNINYNLTETIPEFIKSSLTFATKKEYEHQLLLTKEILGNSKVIANTNLLDRIATKSLKKPVSITVDARNSQIDQHLRDYIKMVFYDDFENEESKILRSASDALINWASLTGIGFNPFVGINNKVFGTIQNNVESAGGTMFSRKDYRRARRFYNNGDAILSYLGGRNKRESTTLQEAIIKRFDVFISQDELAGRRGGPIRTALDKFKLFKDAAYAMQNIGEHTMQNVSLFAMMNSHRIINSQIVNRSTYIESRLEKIHEDTSPRDIDRIIKRNKKEKEKALEGFETFPTLLDSFVLKDGYLEFSNDPISEEELSRFRQKVISVNQYLHGIYNKEDAGTIQKYALGRMAIQFRKWMRPGWNKRFGTKFGKSFWNERREAPDEGMYVTTYNFVRELVKDHGNLSTAYKLQWHKMSEFQRANVRRTLVELSFLSAAYLTLNIARALAEDDEELKSNKIFNMFMYQTDRLWAEIFTYFPIFGWFGESRKILRSPTASYSLVNNTAQLTKNILLYPFRTEDERLYTSGVRYGEDKVTSGVTRLIPFWNQLDRVHNLERNNRFYKLF